ncbi:MAG: ribonucleoside-triphosphate reductase [Candidatus Taylorbacteria bacterium CG11_big_fil_rev_8_21_14_0_20_46_11]|uniref:ribonucleoside-triphosphate reductase (thioredoxin) n=1 Tax=Candidatus Taylorbacteria bacterium CG11_big_fil_rev_8_21_14_0_20_46_11 TaxID=1975025 RepID=A0A2H0KAF4_9BACT|nr:MAG: ribonucleoside-triphosphate reductase [Candidatus Taylorbacteria bacterium CG11_big_fil_rev_8_21_14_0_20_46_11]
MSHTTATPSITGAITEVRKRDGRIVSFDMSRVEEAALRAMRASEEGSEIGAKHVAEKVSGELLRIKGLSRDPRFLPSIELIQDVVEKMLMQEGFGKTAKAYILYREKRREMRDSRGIIPAEVREIANKSKAYFRNPLGEFVYYRSYSKWIPEKGRRETWIETVDRYMTYMKGKLGEALSPELFTELREGILNHEAMPSMRLLQFAGSPADRTNVCVYNCSYIAPTCFKDLSEIMYISMCGGGAGWSVESQNIQKFPQIGMQTGEQLPPYSVPDSKEGWCDALALGLETWGAGKDVEFDYSLIRPSGARLKTMGGRASGPDPLRRLLDFARERIIRRQGKRLTNLDLHDIICMIGDCVVAGGVRRSAMISLSDLDDDEIRDAKKGAFYVTDPQRMLANNSAVYREKPSSSEFMREWIALMESGSGERGIFNRGILTNILPKRRLEALKETGGYFDATGKALIGSIGTNPCGEIILQSKQFCNLSEIVARPEDTRESLLRKIRLATILGTFQSTLTYFPYLSKEWKEHCERERLLGVSITGQWDAPSVRDADMLEVLKAEAIKVNEEFALKFGATPSTAITCVKPSGTLSQMVDSSSGMHPRHAPYYIRRIRIAATDSLFKMLRDQGVPCFPEVGQTVENASTFVLEFPVKAPEGSIFKNDVTALEQLEHWQTVRDHYTEHNPSVTISVGEGEWIAVADWLYQHWDIVCGLSFLPRDNHVYQLAPYEEIDAETYGKLLKNWEHVDFSKIMAYERTDESDLKRELACAGGLCEI